MTFTIYPVSSYSTFGRKIQRMSFLVHFPSLIALNIYVAETILTIIRKILFIDFNSFLHEGDLVIFLFDDNYVGANVDTEH